MSAVDGEISFMVKAAAPPSVPPKLRVSSAGVPDIGSLADILEWFLNFDERTGRIRNPFVEEVFQWKQADDAAGGIAVYPFENAEARFAVGALQALAENDTEPKLNAWIADLINALQDARQAKTELTDAYNLDAIPDMFALAKSEKLTTVVEKRIYLTSTWIEALCTAETRFLGWIYQELYQKPFTPNAAPPEDLEKI